MSVNIKNLTTAIISASILIVLSNKSFADVDKASEFVKNLNNKVLSVMKNKNSSDDKKDIELKNILKTSVDIDWVAKFTLGKHWNTAKESQKKRYLKAYRDYVIFTYLPHFRDYKDQQIILKNGRVISEDKYAVAALLKQPGKEDMSLEYMIHKNQQGSLRVYDFNVEGISMINTQRSDFNSAVSRKNLDHLITRLTKMTQRSQQLAHR